MLLVFHCAKAGQGVAIHQHIDALLVVIGRPGHLHGSLDVRLDLANIVPVMLLASFPPLSKND